MKRPDTGKHIQQSSDVRPSMSETDVSKYSTTASDFRARSDASNDPGWYKYTENVYNTGGNFNYLNQVGRPIHTAMINGGQYNLTVPSLMSFSFTPTPGPTDGDIFSACNQATLALYMSIQQNVQKELPFTPGDLCILITCMDSIYMMYAWLCRLYALKQTMSVMNMTIPNVFLKAMGFDPATITNELGWSDFKKELDIFAENINQIKVPKDIKMVLRHSWLTSNVFTDGTTSKAQFYMFNPRYVYSFSNNGGPRGAFAQMTNVPSFTTHGLRGAIDFVKELYKFVFQDMDMKTLQAWLLRAHPEQDWYVNVTPISDTAVLVPTFVAEVLPQIHNMDIVGPLAPEGPNNGNIIQTEWNGVSQVLITSTSNPANHLKPPCGAFFSAYDKFIDMPTDNIDRDLNYVATRFKVNTAPGYYIKHTDAGDEYRIKLVDYGTEIINTAEVYVNTTDEPDVWVTNGVGWQYPSASYVTTVPPLYDREKRIARWLHFYMGPILYMTNDLIFDNMAGQTDTPTWVDTYSDLTNYATIRADRKSVV